MTEIEKLEKHIASAISAGVKVEDIIKIIEKFDNKKNLQKKNAISPQEINFILNNFQKSS